MSKNDTVENHVKAKKYELIWALGKQDYTQAQIARMFNIDRSTVLRILQKMPRDWSPKWKKVRE